MTTTEQKLQSVVDRASEHLGLRCPVEFLAYYGPFPGTDPGRLGDQRMNRLGTKHLVRVRLDGPRPLHTLLHELRRCWQSEKLGNREQKRRYFQANGLFGYRNNPFEIDANQWADTVEEVYAR